MKHKLILTTLMALFFASIVAAQPMTPPDMPGFGMFQHRMGLKAGNPCSEGPMGICLMGIELSDQQRKDIEKLSLEHQKKMVEHRAKMVDIQSKLRLALTSDKLNQKEIDDLANKIGDLHKEKAKFRATHLRKIRDLLTPEQQTTFDKNVLKPAGRGKGLMHQGWRMGFGGCGKGPCCNPDTDEK